MPDYIDRRTANVYGIYGHLGGGKSLTAVELSVYFLSIGWSVASNISLKHIDHLPGKYRFLEDFSNVDFWALPCGAPRGSADTFRSVIVIDECAEFFDQYSSSSPQLKAFLSWLRHSSKRGQFVFLIVQQPDFIAKSLRLLINKWIVCVDMEQFRLPFLKVRVPFTKNLVWRRVFDRYGNLLSRGWNFADKFFYGRFYETAQSIALAGRSSDYVHAQTDADALIVYFPFFFFLTLIYLALIFIWL